MQERKCPMCGEMTTAKDRCPKCHALLPGEEEKPGAVYAIDKDPGRLNALVILNIIVTAVLVVFVALLHHWTVPKTTHAGQDLYINDFYKGTVSSTTDLPGARIRIVTHDGSVYDVDEDAVRFGQYGN